MRRERFLYWFAVLERRENRVQVDRCAAEDVVSQRVGDAFRIAQQPAPTGGSPIPRAPTGVSGSGISTAAHFMLTGTSRIDGGRFWYQRRASATP